MAGLRVEPPGSSGLGGGGGLPWGALCTWGSYFSTVARCEELSYPPTAYRFPSAEGNIPWCSCWVGGAGRRMGTTGSRPFHPPSVATRTYRFRVLMAVMDVHVPVRGS